MDAGMSKLMGSLFIRPDKGINRPPSTAAWGRDYHYTQF